MQDLLASQIDYYFDPATGFSHIREGRARLLAVTGSKRSPFFPDVPTLTELGIQGVELGNWFGLFAPRRRRRKSSPASARKWRRRSRCRK